MCLLIVVSEPGGPVPLVVGANRDERLDRPALAIDVLRAEQPRVLGGRDRIAGGTWLAVNERGVVAGLTNRPSPEGRDPAKRSRGELPIALARQATATDAVREVAPRLRGEDYNPAWLLVGDGTALFALDLTAPGAPEVEPLGPGVHVLENTALHAPSEKADHVRDLLARAGPPAGPGRHLGRWVQALATVLADHAVPASDTDRRPETLAACVHSEGYGTRSSIMVAVAADGGPPVVQVADGPPCTAPFTEVTSWWGR